jgi:hypothetical protein
MVNHLEQHVVPRHSRSLARFQGSTMPRCNRLSIFNQTGSATQSTITAALAILSLVSVSLLGFFYLHQVFNTAAEGFGIESLEEQQLELNEKIRELELEGAQLRSIQVVEERVKELELVKADEVAYLVPLNHQVALNQ